MIVPYQRQKSRKSLDSNLDFDLRDKNSDSLLTMYFLELQKNPLCQEKKK
ncbi:MAG: hypothetical protein AABW58_00200 [Nanoarchaeota archaeon]